MSPSSTQQWTRRIRYSDQHIRVSDADRSAVAEQLGVHYADGRLDQAEFDERISRTMAAKTRGDLAGLFDDLPDPGPAGAPGTPGPVGPAAAVRPRRRGGAFRSVVLLAIVILLCATAWHAVNSLFFFSVPWFPILLIAAVALYVTRHRRR